LVILTTMGTIIMSVVLSMSSMLSLRTKPAHGSRERSEGLGQVLYCP
jgi:hypothetical protein